MDAGAGRTLLTNRFEKRLALRVLHAASKLAGMAGQASFVVNKNCLHADLLSGILPLCRVLVPWRAASYEACAISKATPQCSTLFLR
jgi:hypothetical protein